MVHDHYIIFIYIYILYIYIYIVTILDFEMFDVCLFVPFEDPYDAKKPLGYDPG